MLHPGYPVDRFHELAPAFPLRFQNFFAGRGETIIPPATLSRFLNPAAANPATFFQAIKKGIEGGDVKAETAARAQLDELPDVIAMAGPLFHQGKDEQFGAALFEFTIEVR